MSAELVIVVRVNITYPEMAVMVYSDGKFGKVLAVENYDGQESLNKFRSRQGAYFGVDPKAFRVVENAD